MDTELRDKLLIRVGVLHKSTPCEAITARLVVDTILPTIQQELTAHTNAKIAKVLDRLESTAVYAEYDKAEDDVICGDVVPLDAIQAERAKLKEVK